MHSQIQTEVCTNKKNHFILYCQNFVQVQVSKLKEKRKAEAGTHTISGQYMQKAKSKDKSKQDPLLLLATTLRAFT